MRPTKSMLRLRLRVESSSFFALFVRFVVQRTAVGATVDPVPP